MQSEFVAGDLEVQWPSGLPFHMAGGGFGGSEVKWCVSSRSEVDTRLIASTGLECLDKVWW